MKNKLDKHQMFLDNEKLIYFTMKKYFPRIFANLDLRDEYYQIGAIGLLHAIDKYDATYGAFSTYAIPTIWGEMKRNIRDNNSIHYTRKIIDTGNKLIALFNESHDYDEDDFENYIEKSLQNLDISEHEKIGVKNYIFKPITLESSSNDDTDITFADKLASTSNIIDDVAYNEYIQNISSQLNDRDKRIFYELLHNYTQQEISKKCNVSQPHVSRIQKNIKLYAIKELWASEQYDTALSKLQDVLSDAKYENAENFVQICQKYEIDITKCPKYILEKRMPNMWENVIKIYSKKNCQKLILKCAMKLILLDEEPCDNINFKQSVRTLLINNNYDNESLRKHLDSMSASQIKSCIDLAKKTIKKYKYKYEYEIAINELDFKMSKINDEEIITNDDSYSCKNEIKIASNVNVIESIITTLKDFKRDNLMLKFQL